MEEKSAKKEKDVITFKDPLLSKPMLNKFKPPIASIDQRWKIFSYKEEECGAGELELPKKQDSDEKMENTEANLEKVEDHKEVETSGPVKPKSKGNKIP